MTDFDAALERHLAAIRRRDLAAPRETVSQETMLLVTSSGEFVAGSDEFLRRHAEWFEQTSWQLEARRLGQVIGDRMAVVVLALRYQDRSPDGTTIDERSVLTLTFRREADDQWRLVHDQNTPQRV